MMLIMIGKFICLLPLMLSVIFGATITCCTTDFSRYEKDIQNGLLEFGHNLLKNLDNGENLLISPINIYSSLHLLHQGSDGETQNELTKVLGLKQKDMNSHCDDFYKNQSCMHFRSLGNTLKKLSTTFSRAEEPEETLANGIFMQRDATFHPHYINSLKSVYPAVISRSLDFENNPKQATAEINNWISNVTKGNIPQIMKQTIDKDAVLVLASAVYFNGDWEIPFNVRNTMYLPFNTGSERISVEMMNDEQDVPIIQNTQLKFEALRLPFKGNQYQMIFILPNEGEKLGSLVKNLNYTHLQDIFVGGNVEKVHYKIPKLKFSYNCNRMEDHLQNMGLKSMFGIYGPADFSAMTNRSVFVDKVVHAAQIRVKENGVEATAAFVAVLITRGGILPFRHKRHFVVDRPYMMILHHKPTNTVQFSALVYKPQYNR